MSPPQSDYNKWIEMIEKLREEDVTGNAPLKDTAKFVKHVILEPSVQSLKRMIEELHLPLL